MLVLDRPFKRVTGPVVTKDSIAAPCPECYGTGRSLMEEGKCTSCDGKGHRTFAKSMDLAWQI